MLAAAACLLAAFLFARITDVQQDFCKAQNVLRDNQLDGLTEQIESTDKSLSKPLGPALEPFREQIEESNRKRKVRVGRLKVARLGLPPQADNPFQVDCGRAYTE